jgi:hypothetical protein
MRPNYLLIGAAKCAISSISTLLSRNPGAFHIVFATSKISYHGVTAVNCSPDRTRKSFAPYYDTKEAPIGWTGENHSTVFKARPHEIIKGHVLMPLETAKRKMVKAPRGLKKRLRP